MSWLPLSFGFPAILFGLLALPVIWWLLRLTPPKPKTEVFPPLRILARVLKKEETPHQSPWWLTLLRLLVAGLVVTALAEPIWNPRAQVATSGSALALVVDNGWASASDWELRTATINRLIKDAETSAKPILLAFTAERTNAQIGPYSAQEARERVNAVRPRPIPTDRPGVYRRVAAELAQLPGATIAMLTDGLAGPDDAAAFDELLAAGPSSVVWATPDRLETVALNGADNQSDRFVISAIRAAPSSLPASMTAGAYDDRGRRIGDAAITFQPGSTTATGEMVLPFELRNDFARVALDGVNEAGAVRLLDENAKRRRVGLLSQTPVDQSRLLLSPLYYIRQALAPFADLVEPASPDLTEAIPQLLAQKPAVIVMGDVGTVPDSQRQPLIDWMNNGGTLIRFASSRLISAGNDPDLLPVNLRLSERQLGGTLSWTEPQAVAEFPPGGPFADLPAPDGVTVTRQVLAEPTPDIVERTWASLADGTPLVTADRREKGMVVLFHITPQATWSNLPISGTFVEMLRRIVQLSRNQGAVTASADAPTASLAPFRMIGANGDLAPPDADARPLQVAASAPPAVTIENPPGLYGSEEGGYAHNLLGGDAVLAPVQRPAFTVPVVTERYAADESRDMKGPLMLAALLLLLIDSLIVLWLAGAFSRWRRGFVRTASAAAILVAFATLAVPVPDARAQDLQSSDAEAIAAISKTHIAYVITGESNVDAVSRAGIEGLTRFLLEKTALEPGEAAGVNIETDELAFYPLIYWPIDERAAMPSEAAVARIDRYMKEGGTIIFDTRDQLASGFDTGSASPATQRLRDILANLNVPPLEPVPTDHVLTKAFFILRDFPGRLSGGPLWVEASLDAENTDNRPVRTGDGVSPILITGNDFAGAWAIDSTGQPLLPTVPNDQMQRAYALRAGVNIVMYVLTGNYKSDQVHVPALLERLGQ